MAISSNVKATKFQIKYTGNNGTYTFSDLKNYGVTDSAILATAQAIVSVQRFNAEKYFKIIDTSLEEE